MRPVWRAVSGRRRGGCRRGGQRSAARSRAEAAARAIAPAAAVRPAGVAGSGRRPPPSDRQTRDPRVSWRSAARAAASAAGARGRMSNAQRARISASAAGASGKAAERQGGRLGGGGDRIPCPAQSPTGFRRARRRRDGTGRGGRAAAASRRASRLGGRPARSRHSCKSFAAGGGSAVDREAQVAQSRCVGVEAQDLGRGRGALQAPGARAAPRRRAGRARRCASRRARLAPAANRGSPSPALPLARAQAGTAAGGGKAWLSGAFAAVRPWLARCCEPARERPRRGRRGGRERG